MAKGGQMLGMCFRMCVESGQGRSAPRTAACQRALHRANFPANQKAGCSKSLAAPDQWDGKSEWAIDTDGFPPSLFFFLFNKRVPNVAIVLTVTFPPS